MSMRAKLNQWDYLIMTASNEAQAQAYESQLKVRQDLGLLIVMSTTLWLWLTRVERELVVEEAHFTA